MIHYSAPILSYIQNENPDLVNLDTEHKTENQLCKIAKQKNSDDRRARGKRISVHAEDELYPLYHSMTYWIFEKYGPISFWE